MTESKCQRCVTVNNPQGLHARPADLIVKAAAQFKSRIELVKESERVDCKSILAILTLAAAEGTCLIIEAIGEDAQAACDAVAELFEKNFPEEEAE